MPDCDAIREQVDALRQERLDLFAQLRAPGVHKAQIIAEIKNLNVSIAKLQEELDVCCAAIRDELVAAKQERADLQAQLPGASTKEKGQIGTEIKKLNAHIAELQDQLDACLVVPPDKVPITATFTGTVEITGVSPNPALSIGGAPRPAVGTFTFSGPNFGTVTVNLMPIVLMAPITWTALNIACMDTITVRQIGASIGSYDRSTGNLTIPTISFEATHAVTGTPGPFGIDPCRWFPAVAPSTLISPLTTTSVPSVVTPPMLFGVPLSPPVGAPSGTIKLVAAGKASGVPVLAPLAGSDFNMAFQGVLAPLPT